MLLALSLTLPALASGPSLAAQGLALGPGDLRIEARADGGYDLFVRKRPEIASILLTESTKDPAMRADNFAYRASDYNEVNGSERRMLNGKALPPANRLYSLISSTPVTDPALGSAFRILIPPVLVYGYPWSRSGTVAVGKGTFINVRSFAKAYADYSGAFLDNPYQIAVSTRPIPPQPAPAPEQPKPEPPPPPEEPQKEAPPPPADDRTSAKIGDYIEVDPGQSLELVVCLDTTESMVPYIDDIKKNLGPIIRARIAGFRSFRVGLVLYKDYWPDEYITRKYPFTADIAAFERNLKSITVMGGRDIPEAEVEALYSAATEFDWSADRRQIVVVTDAAPHPYPQGKILFDDVARETAARRIEADAIIEPTSIAPPNPGHPDFENETKRLASLAAASPKPRLLTISEAASESDRALLEAELLEPLAAQKTADVLAPAAVPAGGASRTETGVRAAAAAAGATHFLLLKTATSGAFSETVSRLFETSTGRELSRDVIWRTKSEGVETSFVNGLRVR